MARTTSWMNFVADLSIILSIFLVCSRVNAQLSVNFYNTSCPNVETIVRNAMTTAVNNEARMGASILRLFFHDCFVQGCDGSVLLDDTRNFHGEKGALPIMANVEAACNATVSCADILALASRDGVFPLGGPSWICASRSERLDHSESKRSQHRSSRSRIYNDTDINATYATGLRANRLASGGDDNLLLSTYVHRPTSTTTITVTCRTNKDSRIPTRSSSMAAHRTHRLKLMLMITLAFE
ncbi:hypothetical protein Dimus_016488 [Dionaea muscipula]